MQTKRTPHKPKEYCKVQAIKNGAGEDCTHYFTCPQRRLGERDAPYFTAGTLRFKAAKSFALIFFFFFFFKSELEIPPILGMNH